MRPHLLIILGMIFPVLVFASCDCDSPSTDSDNDDEANDDVDDDANDDLNDDSDDDLNDDTESDCAYCESSEYCLQEQGWGWLCFEDCCTDCVPCDSDEYCEALFGWEYECFNDCCVEKDLDDKPVIYLYPEDTTEVSVTLNLDADTHLVWSWPPYGRGWNVTVRPDGLIDGLYPYLYYEAAAPNVYDYGIYQFAEGFIVAREDLFDLLENYLFNAGFLGREIGDFLLYWTQELPEFSWYAIYPQFHGIIRHCVDLVIDPAPDSMLRLWLIFEGFDYYPSHLTLNEPPADTFERAGFVAVEWGVIQAFR